jgi:hypothetical protein
MVNLGRALEQQGKHVALGRCSVMMSEGFPCGRPTYEGRIWLNRKTDSRTVSNSNPIPLGKKAKAIPLRVREQSKE